MTVKREKAGSGKKRTRSFRCSDPLWEIVEKTAVDQGKRPTEVIIEALASHVGELIRKDRKLTAAQVTAMVGKVDRLENELGKVKDLLGNQQ